MDGLAWGAGGGGGGKIICKLTSSSCYAKKVTVKFTLKFASSGLEKLIKRLILYYKQHVI